MKGDIRSFLKILLRSVSIEKEGSKIQAAEEIKSFDANKMQ